MINFIKNNFRHAKKNGKQFVNASFLFRTEFSLEFFQNEKMIILQSTLQIMYCTQVYSNLRHYQVSH